MSGDEQHEVDGDDGDALEARFRLQMFALLRLDAIGQLLRTESSQSAVLRVQLARFLAGYYLNLDFAALFAHIRCGKLPKINPQHFCVLPNLLLWTDLDQQFAQNYREQLEQRELLLAPCPMRKSSWDREQLGQLLPAQCSPTLALNILLRERHILEAIFFADHFNDARTGLALRFLTDQCFGLTLFADYTHSLIVDSFLMKISLSSIIEEGVEEYEEQIFMPFEIEKFALRHIEAAIQADVLFHEYFPPYGLLDGLTFGCAQQMAEVFVGLLTEWVHCEDGLPSEKEVQRLSLLFPRPPIYSVSPETSSHNPEVRSWIHLHKCCLAIQIALARANRLDHMVGYFALWLAQSQGKDENELPFLLETHFFSGQTEEELQNDFHVFQTMLSVVLGMDARDKLIRMMASGEGRQSVRIRQTKGKLNKLADCLKGEIGEKSQGMIWLNLKSWAQLADKNDLDGAALFLHTLQQKSEYGRRFLPTLNQQNRDKWYSLYISEIHHSDHDGTSNNDNNIAAEDQQQMNVFERDEHKFKLNQPADVLRLRFLAQHFATVNVPQPMIQMLLELNANEICLPQQGPIQSILNNSQKNMGLTANEPIAIDSAHGNESSAGDGGGVEALAAVLSQYRSKWSTPVSSSRIRRGNGGENESERKKRRKAVEGGEDDGAIGRLIGEIQASIQRMEKEERDEERRDIGSAEVGEEDENGMDMDESGLVEKNEKQRKQKPNKGGRSVHFKQQPTEAEEQENGRREKNNSFATTESDEERRAKMYSVLMKAKGGRKGEEDISTSSSSDLPSSSSHASYSSSAEEVLWSAPSRRHVPGQQSSSAADGRESAFESSSGEYVNKEEKEEEEDAQLMREMAEIGRRLERIKAHFKRKNIEMNELEDDEEEEEEKREEVIEGEDIIGKKAEGSGITRNDDKLEEGSKVEQARIIQEQRKEKDDKMAKKEVKNGATAKIIEIEEGKVDIWENKEDNEECLKTSIPIQIFKLSTSTTAKQNQQQLQQEQEDAMEVISARVPSSAGYHSSASTSSTHRSWTRTIERMNSQRAQQTTDPPAAMKGNNGTKDMFEWKRPCIVERMDFSRLLHSDSEEEIAGGLGDQKQQQNQANGNKKKVREKKWTEIEVFPRQEESSIGSSRIGQPTTMPAVMQQEKKRLNMSGTQHTQLMSEQKEKVKCHSRRQRRRWTPPHWLRLLPPFDGQIRSERPHLPVPLLELKLEGLGSISSGRNIGPIARHQRTFAEIKKKMVTKGEEEKKMMKELAEDQQLKGEGGQKQKQQNIYDSGIGLDQQQQQQHNAGLVVYSIELSGEQIEEMRRMAAEQIS